MTDTDGYAAWAGRLHTALELLLQSTASPTLNDIRTRHAREAAEQYQAWLDARPAAQRGFVDLPGLAS